MLEKGQAMDRRQYYLAKAHELAAAAGKAPHGTARTALFSVARSWSALFDAEDLRLKHAVASEPLTARP